MGEAVLGIFWVAGWAVVITFGVALYMAPTIIAAARKRRDVLPLGLVNFALGGTGLGWLVALVWACWPVGDRGHGGVTVNVHSAPPAAVSSTPARPWYEHTPALYGISWQAPEAIPHGFAPRPVPLSNPSGPPAGPGPAAPAPDDAA